MHNQVLLTSSRLKPECISQAVSSRPDVTPPDYLKELEKLQDQIPAFDTREAMQVMEAELGYPPSQLFSTLATAPTAAASLGQVSPSLGLLIADVQLLQLCLLARCTSSCWRLLSFNTCLSPQFVLLWHGGLPTPAWQSPSCCLSTSGLLQSSSMYCLHGSISHLSNDNQNVRLKNGWLTTFIKNVGPCDNEQQAASHLHTESTSVGASVDGLRQYRHCALLCSICIIVVILMQVYRGVLRKGGHPVAVKVQRPGVRESIALDIYILRWLAG